MTRNEIIELAVAHGANTAYIRDVVVDVFFEPRELAQFANSYAAKQLEFFKEHAPVTYQAWIARNDS